MIKALFISNLIVVTLELCDPLHEEHCTYVAVMNAILL